MSFTSTSAKQANERISEEIKKENEEMDIVSISSSSMYDVVSQLM
jgi:hypothetical protein